MRLKDLDVDCFDHLSGKSALASLMRGCFYITRKLELNKPKLN